MGRFFSVGAVLYIILGLIYKGHPLVDLGPVDVTTEQFQLGAAGLAATLAGLYKQIWGVIKSLKLPISPGLFGVLDGIDKLIDQLAKAELKAAKDGNCELCKELTKARLALLEKVKK